MSAYRGRKCIAPLILNVGNRWRKYQNFGENCIAALILDIGTGTLEKITYQGASRFALHPRYCYGD
jgi:hypothetical protein